MGEEEKGRGSCRAAGCVVALPMLKRGFGADPLQGGGTRLAGTQAALAMWFSPRVSVLGTFPAGCPPRGHLLSLIVP